MLVNQTIQIFNQLAMRSYSYVLYRCSVSYLSILLLFLNYITTSKNQTDVIYLDISKAFEPSTVSPIANELLFKLHKMGWWGKLLVWFKNYLINRDQIVQINNSLSISKPVMSGVPQGSILGLNDLSDILLFVPFN